jgi:hypothetical protein
MRRRPASSACVQAAEGALAGELDELNVKRLRRAVREDERVAETWRTTR